MFLCLSLFNVYGLFFCLRLYFFIVTTSRGGSTYFHDNSYIAARGKKIILKHVLILDFSNPFLVVRTEENAENKLGKEITIFDQSKPTSCRSRLSESLRVFGSSNIQPTFTQSNPRIPTLRHFLLSSVLCAPTLCSHGSPGPLFPTLEKSSVSAVYRSRRV